MLLDGILDYNREIVGIIGVIWIRVVYWDSNDVLLVINWFGGLNDGYVVLK